MEEIRKEKRARNMGERERGRGSYCGTSERARHMDKHGGIYSSRSDYCSLRQTQAGLKRRTKRSSTATITLSPVLNSNQKRFLCLLYLDKQPRMEADDRRPDTDDRSELRACARYFFLPEKHILVKVVFFSFFSTKVTMSRYSKAAQLTHTTLKGFTVLFLFLRHLDILSSRTQIQN